MNIYCSHTDIVPIEQAIPNPRNPNRHPQKQINLLAKIISAQGWRNPIVISKRSGFVVKGHGRLAAAKKLELETVPVDFQEYATEAEEYADMIADNRISELSGFDDDDLKELMEELDGKIDIDLTGFDELKNDDWKKEIETGILKEKYVVPPLSVLDSRQGYWQDRKKAWKALIKSEDGRKDDLIGGGGLQQLAKKCGANINGTSIFDPVLAEVLVRWFCPAGGHVIDPFAGGSVRGLISVILGNKYTGVDLRQEQIDANNKGYEAIAGISDCNGSPLQKPNWICGDSSNIDVLVPGEYDFLLTCPPYADLEKYSDDPKDLSNMKYDDFKEAYFAIIRKSVALLKENAFAAIVVGDVRDKDGFYRDFVGDTVRAFVDAGAKKYNDCVLIDAIGTAAIRAERLFKGARKVVKTHQNVLVFLKGDAKKIVLPDYDFDFDSSDDE